MYTLYSLTEFVQDSLSFTAKKEEEGFHEPTLEMITIPIISSKHCEGGNSIRRKLDIKTKDNSLNMF